MPAGLITELVVVNRDEAGTSKSQESSSNKLVVRETQISNYAGEICYEMSKSASVTRWGGAHGMKHCSAM